MTDDTERPTPARTVVNGGNAPPRRPSTGSLYRMFSELKESITEDDDDAIKAQVEIETTKHRWDAIVTISTSKTGLAAIGVLALAVLLFGYWAVGGFNFEADTSGLKIRAADVAP